MTCPNLDGTPEPSSVRPIYTPENPCCEMPQQYYFTIEEIVNIGDSLNAPMTIDAQVSESLSIADDADESVEGELPTTLFDDTFVGSAGVIDDHLVDTPASTDWANTTDSNPDRQLELDGSGNVIPNINFIEELTFCQATAMEDGTSTPREITHTGSVELTVDIIAPSANINPRTSHQIKWLQWTSGLYTFQAFSNFQIIGGGLINMSFVRNGEDPDENTLTDNEVSLTNVAVDSDVAIRLGWKISADMDDVELWWAPLSDLNDKTVIGSASGTHGPYTPDQGNVVMQVNGAAGDGSGTVTYQDPIARVMIVQYP